ncbi:unnamed protein product, partial [Ascophyllum nodosum]
MVMHKWLNGLQWYVTIRYGIRYDCHAFFSLVLSERLGKERRQKAAELLARLRDKHDADKERARRFYTESSFEVAVVAYGEAIASLQTVMCHIRLHGDVDG